LIEFVGTFLELAHLEEQRFVEYPLAGSKNDNLGCRTMPKGDIHACAYYYAYADRQN